MVLIDLMVCVLVQRPEKETWEDTCHDSRGCWRVSNNRIKGSREVQHHVKNATNKSNTEEII